MKITTPKKTLFAKLRHGTEFEPIWTDSSRVERMPNEPHARATTRLLEATRTLCFKNPFSFSDIFFFIFLWIGFQQNTEIKEQQKWWKTICRFLISVDEAEASHALRCNWWESNWDSDWEHSDKIHPIHRHDMRILKMPISNNKKNAFLNWAKLWTTNWNVMICEWFFLQRFKLVEFVHSHTHCHICTPSFTHTQTNIYI